MIMVLSCFDLVSVVTIYPGILLYLISWLREDYDLLPKIKIYRYVSDVFLGSSFLALLVMSIERYLGAYHPIFHRTSVTRRRLLTLLAILLIPTTVINILTSHGLVISDAVFLIICVSIFFPPFMFVNVKLFIIVRKVHRERTTLPEKRTTISFKNISTASWAVACLMLFSIPASFYIAFSFAEKSTSSIQLSYIWFNICATMNCSFNSLIFFWKNKVLRSEGIKILKTLKDRFFRS